MIAVKKRFIMELTLYQVNAVLVRKAVKYLGGKTELNI